MWPLKGNILEVWQSPELSPKEPRVNPLSPAPAADLSHSVDYGRAWSTK
jgi:hypothetical protein